jgi:hypothetical protein
MNPLPGKLPKGWHRSDDNRAIELHAELQRELPPGHLLYGVPVDVVAHREGTDDILCRHRQAAERFTVVHLSWIGKQEIDTRHPHVEDDGDFTSFLQYESAFHDR